MRTPLSLRKLLRKSTSSRRRALRRRVLQSERLEQRQLLAGDVQLRFEFVDAAQSAVTSLSVGQDYTLRAYVQDVQTTGPDGIFRAYLDVNYSSSLATASGSITHGPGYSMSTDGNTNTAGVIDEVGGSDSDATPPSNDTQRTAEYLLFSTTITPTAPGTLNLSIDDADGPTRSIQMWDLRQIPTSEVTVVGGSIEIASNIIITPTTGLQTSEAGGSSSFTVRLGEQPTGNVSFNLSSSDTTEGTIDKSSLSFTSTNWNTPQTVTVTGVNDSIADGNVPFQIITSAITSTDSKFNGVNPSDISVTNLDDGDAAGITILDATGLTTRESGTRSDTFRVVLNSQPTATVTIPLSSNNALEGTVSPSQLVFTTSNWNVPQTVTVTGQNDDIDDGDQSYKIVLAKPTGSDAAYTALSANEVTVTNVDDDTAGVVVTPTSGLVTGEDGRTATFTVRLQSRPLGNVTVGLVSSDTTEGTLSTSSLSFNVTNWNTPQTVTVTGLNDNVDDGDIVYSVITTATSSADPKYQLSASEVPNVSLTNADDADTAGFTISPATGLTTAESGAQQNTSFTIRLSSQPTATVVVSFASSDSSEGTVSPASQTFTTSNWNSPRTITISGVNDALSDGNIDYAVQVSSTSTDPKYVLNQSLPVTNVDDDPAGVTISRTSGLRTTEGGGTDSLNIRLDSQPTGNVVVSFTSSDTTEGTVAPSPITFSTTNWNVAQTVTLTGVDDPVQDGDIGYTISLSLASNDPAYDGLQAPSISATNADNEVNVTIQPVGDAITDETGRQATFSVSIDKEPTSNVTIALSSSDLTEGTVSPASVVFTPQNWNQPKTFTVTGVDDNIDDGDVSYTIVTSAIQSSDPNYSGVNPADVTVVNQSAGDQAAVIVNADPDLTTTEAGGTATFTVALATQPVAPVTIDLTSSNTSEGTVSPIQLTFTTSNWNTPRTVTVTGVDDLVDDGDASYSVRFDVLSADGKYNDLPVSDQVIRNTNNDVAGLTLTPATGLVTSEDGAVATFTVQLTSQPLQNVTVTPQSDDSSEGLVTSQPLTFTSTNWNQPQTVTVVGQNDDVKDGSVDYTVGFALTSTDPKYNDLAVGSVQITNEDNEIPVTISAPSSSTTGEDGTSVTFTVVLDQQPTDNVTIDLSSSDLGEATIDLTSLTFTGQNWDTPQTVTVTGVDDFVDDGNVDYRIITSPVVSNDPDFSGLKPADVLLTNNDNGDVAGINVSPRVDVTTSETAADGSTEVTVALNSEPTASVIVELISSDTGEGTVAPTQLIFDASNWDTPQTVTLTGVDDFIDDGPVDYAIRFNALSADPKYNAIATPDLVVSNLDDDVAGVRIESDGPLSTSEDGGVAIFTVQLDSQPTADVTIALASDNTAEGTVAPQTLTFTTLNWNVPQTVTATGVDDTEKDGDVDYSIQLTATSTDSVYNAIPIASVVVTNQDDEVPITISAPSAVATSETGTEVTFTIVLDEQPSSDVTIGLSSSDTTEATLDIDSVVFTSDNWNVPQTITVRGVDDDIDDGDVDFRVITSVVQSDDPLFSGFDPRDILLTNQDDGDTAGITLTPSTTTQTSEAGTGTAATMQFVLDSQPTSDVTIAITSTDTTEGTVSASSLVFTADNWNVAQSVTVSGVNDDIDDGDIDYQIQFSVSSDDAKYAALTLPAQSFQNLNDDTAGVTVTPPGNLTTGEDGTSDQFVVVLNSEPTSDVTVTLVSSDTTEGTVDPQTLTFTPANWNIAQTVTVSGVDDSLEDDQVDYTVDATISSDDAKYAAVVIPAITASNIDDEVGVRFTPAGDLETSENGTPTFFDAVLTKQPTGEVRFDLATNDSGEVTISHSQLVFTPDNWDVPQRVTAIGVDDASVDGDIATTIVTSPVVSDDVRFSGFNPRDLTIINRDNDTARLRVTAVSASQDEGTVGGTTAFTFDLALTGNVTGGFDIEYTTNDGTATAASGDYVDNDGSLSFVGTDGETHQVTVLVNHDNIVELNEQFQFALGALTATTDSIRDRITTNGSPITLTIVNDDTATITLTGQTNRDEGTASGNDTIDYTVTLSNPVQDGLSLDYATSNGTATAGDDYVANSGTLTFSGTELTKTISVQITRDNKVETDETFQLAIGPITDVSAEILSQLTLVDPSITTTLVNDDSATLRLIPPAATDEGSAQTTTPFDFRVELSAPVQGELRIPFSTVDGTATVADNDYVARTGTLVFFDGSTTPKVITIDVNQDDRVEASETFSVSLGTPTGPAASILSELNIEGSPATATIQNDDFPRLILSPLAPSETEGTGDDATVLSFMVQLTDAVPGGFVLPYTTDDGTAFAGSDYIDNDGTLTFNGDAGETQVITVSIVKDSRVEGDETFELNLGQLQQLASGQRVDIPDSRAIVTIVDDDTTTLSIDQTNVTQNEGTSATGTEFLYTVTLSNPIQTPFSLPYATVDGTARAADGDFTAVDSTLDFGGTAGETQTVRIVVAADNIVEANESFSVAFGNLIGVPNELADRVTVDFTSITASIVDDDTATIAVADVSGPESAGALTFNVTASAIVQGGFSIGYSLSDGTATLADNDYVNTNGTLTFDGVTQRSVVVQIGSDAKVERSETFQLILAALTGLPAGISDRVTLADNSATATITNDDTAQFAFTAANSTVQEAAGSHSFNVRLDAGAGGSIGEAVTVNITATGTGTASSADYTLTTTSLTFPAGSTTGTTLPVQLQLTDDNLQEPFETAVFQVAVAGDAVDGAVSVGSPSTHTVEIQDDPRTAVISGSVWVDANQNTSADAGEMMLHGITVRLSGTDLQGQAITAATATDALGRYQFTNLPAGTYTVTQQQPTDYHDGNAVAGSTGGTVLENQITGIVLEPAGVSQNNSFMEAGKKAQYVNSGRILSRPIQRDTVSSSEVQGVQLQRSGATLTILGSDDRDIIEVTPASSASGQHILTINGATQSINASDVSVIRIEGGGGDDDVIFRDTAGNDRLTAAADQAILETANLRIESIANEFVEAISSGGSDQADRQALDFILRLSGDWQ
ncbi:Calx-beta domain-containing protein [Rosistilla oblonga]|uniref:beta strand repeat-containing protein n=1 Tax=Rosistilla oblonga TaxID=2527990 RepID=UPI003A972782